LADPPLRFVFIEFRNVDDAVLAVSALHGHPFDAKHTFKVNHFTDVERFAELDETYAEPEEEEYVPKVRRAMAYFKQGSKHDIRSTSVHGSQTPRDATNMSHTGEMRSTSTGMESHHRVNLRTNLYVSLQLPIFPILTQA
jgi:hypothetical protein